MKIHVFNGNKDTERNKKFMQIAISFYIIFAQIRKLIINFN